MSNLFPYNVLYAVEKDTIVIVAVAHQKRRPSYWKAAGPVEEPVRLDPSIHTACLHALRSRWSVMLRRLAQMGVDSLTAYGTRCCVPDRVVSRSWGLQRWG